MAIETKKKWIGFTFITPWVLGFFTMYLLPLIESLVYTFNHLIFGDEGLEKTFVGWYNYQKAFTTDPDFMPTLTESLSSLLYQVPLILIFSMIIALLLNQRFRGRLIARAIFFVPVIIASGIVINILNGDSASEMLKAGEKSSNIFKVEMFTQALVEAGLSTDIVTMITTAANSIFELSWRSGVQILLFLAGLQSVSPSLYEAADIDGCTAWERFWKITFPICTPILLVNMVYTITDNFTTYTNSTMRLILEYGQKMEFAYSATLAWIYFAVIVVVLGLVFLLIRKRISYFD